MPQSVFSMDGFAPVPPAPEARPQSVFDMTPAPAEEPEAVVVTVPEPIATTPQPAAKPRSTKPAVATEEGN